MAKDKSPFYRVCIDCNAIEKPACQPLNGHDVKEYDAVTSVLGVINKPELVAWAAREGARAGDAQAHVRIAKDAAQRGTDLHAYINERLAGRVPLGLSPDAEVYRPAADRWLEEMKPRAVLLNRPVWSRTKAYCGTLDAILAYGDRVYLTDFKTVRAADKLRYPPYWEHELQTEAYRRAHMELLGDTTKGRSIVRFAPEGAYRIATWDDAELNNRCFLAFSAAITLYREQRRRKRENKEGAE